MSICCRINRTSTAHENYMCANTNVSVLEMDTIEGVKGAECSDTLLFLLYIENSILHESRCKVFYCDPAASYQKGTDIISSHINSYKRKKLNNYSLIDVFIFLYGKHILKKLNLTPISPEKYVYLLMCSVNKNYQKF